MNKITGSAVLLTSDDVRQWQIELQKWETVKADAEGRIDKIRQKLEAAALISGVEFHAIDAEELADEAKCQGSMGDASLSLLAEFQRPITHQELQAALRAISRFREMLDKNNGAYYYTMMHRLVKRGEVRKTASGKLRLVHKDETPPEGNPEGVSKAVEG